ncbi:MAG: hypothetical protein JKY48_14205 [Flavobacteriales bacterium]|nr:hypothetical protein [Flavobacteriales bacterium]
MNKVIIAKIFLFTLTVIGIYSCGVEVKKTVKSLAPSEEVILTKEESDTELQEFNVDDLIREIKTNFQSIESKLPSLVSKGLIEEESGASVELKGYYQENNPVKIVRSQTSEHGALTTSYYLKDGVIFFVYKELFSEASVNGPFTIDEGRFYINNGELIRALKKEKTVKEIKKMSMSTLPNIDITEELENKSRIVDAFISECKSHIKQLSDKNTFVKEGRWISEDDYNSGIEIKNNKWILFYKGDELSIYDYKITTDVDSKVQQLSLTNNDSEAMEYSILEWNNDFLQLSYLPRGNTLRYKREKIQLGSIENIPSEIDGCSCYYSSSEKEFKRNNYLYIDNYENIAFVMINKTISKFERVTTENISEKNEVAIWKHMNYELRLETQQVSQIDETWQQSGKLLLKFKGELVLEKDIYGECGC